MHVPVCTCALGPRLLLAWGISVVQSGRSAQFAATIAAAGSTLKVQATKVQEPGRCSPGAGTAPVGNASFAAKVASRVAGEGRAGTTSASPCVPLLRSELRNQTLKLHVHSA